MADQDPYASIAQPAGGQTSSPASDPYASIAQPDQPAPVQKTAGPSNPYAGQNRSQATVSAAPPEGILDRARESVANSFVGRNLQTYAPNVATALHLTPTESETAAAQSKSDTSAFQWHPVQGVKQAAAGAKKLVAAGFVPGGSVPVPNTVPVPKTANVNQAAQGATQAMGGLMEATKPLILTGVAAAPIRSAIEYGAGILAGNSSAAVAEKMGATPDEQEFLKTAGFFIPSTLASVAGVHSFTETQGPVERGGFSAFGGKVNVTAARSPEAVGVAGQVGPIKAGWVKPRDTGVQFSDKAPTGLPGSADEVSGQSGSAAAPPPAPSAPAVQAQQKVASVSAIAARAAGIKDMAEQATGLKTPPPPPPPPGAAGSKTPPLPAGMDDGHLSQQTVEHAGTAIQSLSPDMRPKAILETVGNLSKWIQAKGTIVGPDGKITTVTGQSPQAQAQSARTIATNIINDEVERQGQKAQDAVKQKQDNAETVQKEQEAALQGTKAPTAANGEPESPVVIPKSPQVDRARAALQSAPPGATASQLEVAIRNSAMVTTPVRKALVQEEIARRANVREQEAETAMTGEAPAPGQSREELQAWANGVARGEHPFVHIPQDSTFKPTGVDELVRTPVKGAGAFSGTYYHSPEVKPAEIRKAARDKNDPQGALDQIVANFKGDEPQQKAEEPAAEPAQTEPAEDPYAEIASSEEENHEVASQTGEENGKPEDAGRLIVHEPRTGRTTVIPEESPAPLPPEVSEGLASIVEDHAATNPLASLETVLKDKNDGKIVAQALVNDGIITNSDMNPATALLTSQARKKLTTSVLGEMFGDELMQRTPDFIREKLSGVMGTVGIINSKQDAWNLKQPLQEAIASYNLAYRGEALPEDLNPVVSALVSKLDGPIDKLRQAMSLYAVNADSIRDSYAPDGEPTKPFSAFNVSFGTELTEEQYDAAIKNAGAPRAAEPVPSAPSEPRQLAKGDKVTYRTNKGKERTGEVAWTDGKKVRISDNGSTVNKNIEDVSPVERAAEAKEPAGRPEPSGEATLVDALQMEFDRSKGPKDYNSLKKIVTDFDGAAPNQMRMKEAQEAYEAMLNRVAADIVTRQEAGHPHIAYDRLVNLYEGQPNLSIRTSTSIANQAYSTPLPLAFIADKFAGVEFGKSVYEPTAGNGALLISAEPKLTYANELDQGRAGNLKAEGFNVTQQDATTFTPPIRTDAVVANPPFAKLAAPVKIDGYDVVKLDHLIAAKALGVMKDNGRAAIIIAAGDRETPGQITNQQRPFFNWLYSHYNVVSDFELNGDLYARQGASYPVRVIAVDGRVRSAKVCPMPEDIKRLNTWREVYEHADQHLGTNLEGQRRADDESGSRQRAEGSESSAVPATHTGRSGGTDLGQSEARAAGLGGGERPARVSRPLQHTGTVPDPGVGSDDLTVRSDGDVAQSDRLAEGQRTAKPVRRESAKPDGHSANALADETNQFQATYHPYSEKQDVAVMAPKALIAPMQEAMARVSDDVGDIDEWLAGELGYPDVDTMHDVLMGTQIDGIAAAIHQISQGKAVIIADQTGLGKGRQAAAVIRWAEMHGHIPVFVTAQAQLFTDMHRDLHDIGSGDTITPLLFNADATVTDPVTGKKIFGNNGSMRPVFERISETGELPAGRNAVYLTYSQINTSNRQQTALQRLAPRAVFVLDESHNAAGGDSNTGQYLQGIIAASKGATFLSATWAKRPDNLPLYADKTDLAIAIPDKEKIADAITAGGAPLQAVVTHQLTESGQHVRRERSFDGITIENEVDEGHRLQHEAISDKVTEVLRGIVHADMLYHLKDFSDIADKMKRAGKAADSRKVVVNHMEFSSVVHNLTKQMLLALKADEDANKIIAAIEDGKKPIYALENTMGSFLDGYVSSQGLHEGDLLPDLSYSKILDRALMRTRYYNMTDEMGNKSRVEVPLDMLSPAVRRAYDETQALIDYLDVDLPVSPIDHIRNKVEQTGHKIAEITGRTLRLDYSGNIPKLSTVPGIEKRDRVNTASQFNNGGIDALIVNQAGSTGISLHAGEKFRDQRPRKMIVGQPAGDVNIVMQMLGRINRTGQVQLPEYAMSAVALPAEQRPAINLAKKMKSLNANVSSNTRSATSIKAVDLMNKYGDQIVGRYLVDNPDMMSALGLDVDEGENGKLENTENLAMKATGRSALLPVKEQREFMDAISEAYTNYISFLDETGQNDLEPKTYDFDARENHIQRIYQGTGPKSPFGQDAHYGEYSIKRQGKPFTPEEVEAKIAETFGPEAMKLMPRERDTLAARDLAAHMESLYKPYRETLSTNASIERAEAIRQAGRGLLNDYRVGVGLRIEINGDTMNGIVTRIDSAKKPSGNPYAPSALQFTIAVNDPMRQIRVPGSQLRSITMSNLGRNASVRSLFQDYVGDSRQKAKIITGNLLGAYGSLEKGVKGRIISFTMADGTVKQGILMPSKFDVDKDVSQDYAMRSAEGALEYLNTDKNLYLHSSGDEVGIIGNPSSGMQIRTKISKSVGGKFFLDPKIRECVVGGEFASQNGLMKAWVKDGSELDALKAVLMKTALYPNTDDADRAREADEKAQANLAGPEPPTTPGPAGKRLAKKQGSSVTMSFLGTGALDEAATKAFQPAVDFAKAAVPATMDDLLKAAKLTTRTMKQAGRDVLAVLYPRALASAEANSLMGRYKGDQAFSQFQAAHLLDGIDKIFKGMPEEDQIKFLDRWMTGKEQPTEDLQKAQDLMQSIQEGQRELENEAANLGRKEPRVLQDRPNYFPLRYKTRPGAEPPLAEEDNIARIQGAGKRPLEGRKGFMKQKKYQTASEAKDAGAEFSGTPVDMFKQRLAEGMKFVTARQLWSNGRDMGLVRFLRAGRKMPAGYSKVDDKLFRAMRPVETEEGGTLYQQTGQWVVDEDFARLLNNYLSRDMIRDTTLGRAAITLKNFSTMAGFAFSPFHWMGTTMRAWSGALQVGGDRLWNQGVRNLDPAAAAKGFEDIGKAIIAPYTAVRFGKETIQYARNPDEFLQSKEGKNFAARYPELPKHLQGLYRGGLRWGMPDVYKYSLANGFTDAIKSGHLGAATLKVFPWITEAINKPLFEHYVPALKFFYAVQMATAKLDQYAEAIANGDVSEDDIYRQVASATENQFGELHLENMDWNNTMRSAAQLLFRSASWKIGTWGTAVNAVKELGATGKQAARLVSGGKIDSSAQFDDHIYDRVAQENDAWDKARRWTRRIPEIGVNQGTLISLCMTTAILGTIITKLVTGKWPADWAKEESEKLHISWEAAMALETAHPRTGAAGSHGDPQRFSLPTDLKDYEHALNEPAKYARGSASDMLSNGLDTMENRTSFGNYVFNPDDPRWKQLGQIVAYNLAGDFEPYVLRRFAPMRAADKFGPQDTKSKIEGASGLFGNPPKSFGQSAALNEAIHYRDEKPKTPLTPEQQEEQALAKQQPPTRHQVLRAAREKNLDYLQRVILHDLTYSQAKDIFDNYATPAEREELRPIIRRKQEAMIRSTRR